MNLGSCSLVLPGRVGHSHHLGERMLAEMAEVLEIKEVDLNKVQ